jgi:hypothetical protein
LPSIFESFKLILTIFIVAHICGCGFHFLVKQKVNTDQNWVIKNNLENAKWLQRYVDCLYFSFTTMITVGFGDTVPCNIYEKLYVMVMMLISCGVFGYSINMIGSIF